MTAKTSMKERLLTEDTEKHFYTDQLLACFLKGESAVVNFVAGAGRKRTFTYLVENAHNFNYQSLGKYVIVYVDMDELTENNEETYFLLMLRSLTKRNVNSSDVSPFFALKEEVQKLLNDGSKIIFIFGRFDDLDFSSFFFNNLKSLRDLDKKSVNFVFPVNRDIFSKDLFNRYDRLKEILVQNKLYFPLFSVSDAKFSLERRIKKYGYKVSEEQKKLILKLAGGHPALIKICLRLSSEGRLDEVNENFEVKLVLEEIWDSLSEDEKLWLKKDEVPERLQKLNLGHFFSPLFETFINRQKTNAAQLTINENTGEILADGQALREKFSLNEYRLLANFLRQKNHVFSKDDIAEILWGEDSFDNYSDWAIEKVLSSVRKKIRSIGVDDKSLSSIRNRGYRWVE